MEGLHWTGESLLADTTATNQPGAGTGPYCTTSYAFGNGTTSTLGLRIWRTLSEHLLNFQAPMTAAELGEQVGISPEQINAIFGQIYYQRHYGFRQFKSLEEWESWAKSTGVLYSPELHDPKPEDEDDLEEDGDDDLDDE